MSKPNYRDIAKLAGVGTATVERVRSVEADLLEATRASSVEYGEGEFAVRAVLAE